MSDSALRLGQQTAKIAAPAAAAQTQAPVARARKEATFAPAVAPRTAAPVRRLEPRHEAPAHAAGRLPPPTASTSSVQQSAFVTSMVASFDRARARVADWCDPSDMRERIANAFLDSPLGVFHKPGVEAMRAISSTLETGRPDTAGIASTQAAVDRATAAAGRISGVVDSGRQVASDVVDFVDEHVVEPVTEALK